MAAGRPRRNQLRIGPPISTMQPMAHCLLTIRNGWAAQACVPGGFRSRDAWQRGNARLHCRPVLPP